jgi:FtsH-binding integral membrane protein
MTFADIERPARPSARTAEATLYDAALRQHMLGIYNYMGAGLALSGATAFLLTQTGASALFYTAPGQYTPLGWGAMFAPLGLLLVASFTGNRLSVQATHALYWSIAALQGVGLSVIVQSFTGFSVAQILLVTAAAFGALALYGYSTQRSLSGMGTLLFIGLIGVIIAFIANIFLQSPMLQFVASVIGVLVFAGLTAFDTQRLRDEYNAGVSGEAAAKSQVWGALSLYLSFINLFQLLLTLFGQRQTV